MALPHRDRQVLAGLISSLAVVALTCVIYMGASSGPTKSMSLAEHREELRAHSRVMHERVMQELDTINFGATVVGNTGSESGNSGGIWNYGQDFGGGSGSPTQHSGGVGQFGEWGVGNTMMCLDHTEDEHDCGSYTWHGKTWTGTYHYTKSCDADEGCVYTGYTSTHHPSGSTYEWSRFGDGHCSEAGKPGPNLSCYCAEQNDCL